MKIFEYARSHPEEVLAITDTGEEIRYGEMNRLAEGLREEVGRRLVFILCRNTPGSLVGYLALLQAGCVPLLLDADIAPPLLQGLVETYRPAYCLVPGGQEGNMPQTALVRDYVLARCAPEGADPALAPDLRLLLATSGSTGSSKLVRISARNLDANAASIIEYLHITEEDRPITVLPMQYSYGMSILHTHVMAGATILLTRHTLMEKRFWERARGEGATSLSGVPYTFEMFARLGLMDMDLPALRTVTQAGGKLPEKRQLQFANWAAKKGIRFYVMYGQTEASPRMAYLPPEKAVEKCGSMGIAIPGGRLDLVDEAGAVMPPGTPHGNAAEKDLREQASADGDGDVIRFGNTSKKASRQPASGKVQGSKQETGVGELVYTGENVALGYAECAEDLEKGDEFHGILRTGDMARRDADGYFYIVGRRSRFIKMTGRRIGLDEVEKILHAHFPDLDIACAGRDEELEVYVAAGQTGQNAADVEKGPGENIVAYVEEMTGIPERRVTVSFLTEIPRSSAGKIRYAALGQEEKPWTCERK